MLLPWDVSVFVTLMSLGLLVAAWVVRGWLREPTHPSWLLENLGVDDRGVELLRDKHGHLIERDEDRRPIGRRIEEA